MSEIEQETVDKTTQFQENLYEVYKKLHEQLDEVTDIVHQVYGKSAMQVLSGFADRMHEEKKKEEK